MRVSAGSDTHVCILKPRLAGMRELPSIVPAETVTCSRHVITGSGALVYLEVAPEKTGTIWAIKCCKSSEAGGHVLRSGPQRRNQIIT